MRQTTLLLFAWITLCAWAQQAATPAFPGAEGHGRYTPGGRGGKIVHVKNLNDSGTGSFREAVKGSDKKIVVFDVGGVIALESDVNIGPNTTIAGQTAPAPGITLRYYTVYPKGDNIVMRFIRIRRGEEKDVNDGADAITARNYTQMMIDHCSFSWSIDEVASFYDNNNFTMQWCTIGESLNNAGHNKGTHGYGGIWGGKLASFHHNMICHVNNRSPRFNGTRYDWPDYVKNLKYEEYKWENALQAENVDFRNCVVYNCANGCYGGPGGGFINMVGNYYKTGPAGNTTRTTKISVASEDNAAGATKYLGMTSRYYIEGNQVNQNTGYDWTNIAYDEGVVTINGELYSKDTSHYNGSNTDYVNYEGEDYVRIRLDNPVATGEVTTHTAATAYSKVLDYAGASLTRDNVDTRYVTEARNGTATYTGSVTGKKGRIDKVADVEGYTEANFGTGSRADDYDADGDGMADAWERANGLDPDDATDAKLTTIDPDKYYTNVEVFLNSLVQDIMLNGNADGDNAVKDYYPAYVKEDGTRVEAINKQEGTETEKKNIEFLVGQSTNLNNNTSDTYYFQNGVTITNKKSKEYAAGKENGIKFSAGVQYTVNLPEDTYIQDVTFTGYDNYDDKDSYLSEVAGTAYTASQYSFPKKDASGNYILTTHTLHFDQPLTESFTFTPTGKQVVLTITLAGTQGGTEEQAAAGDVNHDGIINIIDVTSIISHILGQTPSTFFESEADINKDGIVNIVDVTMVIDTILKQE
jgi:hypothetical protein